MVARSGAPFPPRPFAEAALGAPRHSDAAPDSWCDGGPDDGDTSTSAPTGQVCTDTHDLLPPPFDVPRSCDAAAMYLAVAAQEAVRQHYQVNSTVARSGNTLLREGNFAGQKGEGDEVAEYQAARAEAGDASAQMWLGQQYYWGHGGLPRDPARAAQWFEQARLATWACSSVVGAHADSTCAPCLTALPCRRLHRTCRKHSTTWASWSSTGQVECPTTLCAPTTGSNKPPTWGACARVSFALQVPRCGLRRVAGCVSLTSQGNAVLFTRHRYAPAQNGLGHRFLHGAAGATRNSTTALSFFEAVSHESWRPACGRRPPTFTSVPLLSLCRLPSQAAQTACTTPACCTRTALAPPRTWPRLLGTWFAPHRRATCARRW